MVELQVCNNPSIIRTEYTCRFLKEDKRMKKQVKQILAWSLALTLTVGCSLSGLVLPVAAESNNLLVNGDLEQAASVGWGSSAQVVDGAGRDGSRGIKITTTVVEGEDSVSPGVYYKGPFNEMLEANTTYLFTFDYKHEGKGFPQFDVVYAGTDWQGWKDTTLKSNVDWTTHTIEFTTGSFANMNEHPGWEWQPRIVHYANAANYGTGTVYYDNFSLVKKPTAATGISLNKTTATVTVGSSMQLEATASPTGAPLPAITWTSSDDTVASVDNGKVVGKAIGSATITATAAGLPSVTCTVTVAAQPAEVLLPLANGDFSGANSGWTYGSTVSGKFSKGDPVPVATDSADGNNYIVIPAGGATIVGPTIEYDISAGDWIRVEFKVRKNAAGKMRFAMQIQGEFFSGYAQPDWTISASESKTSNDGEWVAYTAYAKAANDTESFYLAFLEIAGNTTAGLTLDLDDVKVSKINIASEDDLNLLYNGTMNFASSELNDYNYEGLFRDGGVIEADPSNASNKVLHLKSNAQAYFLPNFRIIEGANDVKTNLRYRTNTVYRLTYRQKGAGTTSPLLTPGYGTVLSTEGEPGVASATWKTITVYLKTAASVNSNFLFDFKTTGDVYLDDMALYEVNSAVSLTLDQTSLSLLPADTVTLTAITTPPGIPVEWKSDDTAVATVDANGKVTAVSDGQTVITATCGTLTATCTVKVKDPGQATAIVLDKTEISLVKGASQKLTVITEPAASRYDSLSWKSSDDSVVTVAADGTVTASMTAGKATVTATAMVGTTALTATCTVIVMTEATGLRITEDTVTLAPPAKGYAVYHTLQVQAEPKGSYTGVLTWNSSDETVATVDANGRVTTCGVGTTTITVSNGVLSDTCTIKVAAEGERLSGGTFDTDAWNINLWTYMIIKDGNGSVVADPTSAGNRVLALPKNDDALSALWLRGLPLNPGMTYALTFDLKGDGAASGQRLALYTQSTSVTTGGWTYFAADKNWTKMTYIFTTNTLDDGTSAALNRNYVFGFDNMQGGTLYLDNISLVELPEAESISLVPSDRLELAPQATASLTLRTEPAAASTGALTWNSSAPDKVMVDSKGNITAVANSGSAVITVSNDKGKTAAITVTVSEYANQFLNGDFEQGASVNWANYETIKPGIGKDGGYGFELVHDQVTGERTTAYYKAALQLKPATTYLFSVDYLATEGCTFRFWSYGFGLRNPTYEEGDGTQWRTASITFTTPTDMELRTGWDFGIVCDKTGKKPAVIDNLVLKKYTSGVAPESVTLSMESMVLIPGRSYTLTAHAQPTNGDLNDIVWTSSDENVAIVEYGVITGVGKGEATITATTKNGKRASCKVTVAGEPALIKNGTFDIAGDTSWVMTNGAALAPEKGVISSNAAVLAKDSVLSQEFTGLKSRTTYQLMLRYYSLGGSATVKLTNGTGTLVEKSTGNNAAWTTLTYEFKTGYRVNAQSALQISTTAQGPIYVDNVILAEKASLIDLEASSVVWGGGNEQVKPGTPLTLAATVTNRGSDRVNVGETFTVEICKNGEVIRTLEYTCTNAKDLEQNCTVIVISEDKWIAEEGEYVISARVNYDQNILEMNTQNNTAQSCLRVTDTFYEIPEVALQSGMTNLTFSDDFDSYDSIDRYATGKDGYKWYVNRQWSASTVTPNDYTIKDGVIRLHANEPTYNITLSTLDAKTGNGFSYRMGYMEVRLRIVKPTYDREAPGATGGIPAVWGFPNTKWLETPGENTQWVEMDWMEYWGKDAKKYSKYPDGYFTTTFHDQIQGEGAKDHWYSNTNAYQNGLGDGEWHTMGWLWASDLLVCYLDGVEYMRLTYDLEGFPTPMMRVHSGVPQEGAFSYMNYQYAALFLGGAVDNPMDVDYVQIWQGGDGVVDMSGTVVDMLPDAFWHNYCTDDWADAIHTVTPDNKQNILDGEELWDRLTSQRRTEINAYLQASGQVTYEELLAQAKATPDKEVTPPAPPTPPKPTRKPGDTNGDGKATVTDMLAIKAHLLGKSKLTGDAATAADTNGSGSITITDFLQVKAHILGKSTLK